MKVEVDERILQGIISIEELEEKIAPLTLLGKTPITVRPNTIVWSD